MRKDEEEEGSFFFSRPFHLEREHSHDEKKLFLRTQEERDHLLNQQVNGQ